MQYTVEFKDSNNTTYTFNSKKKAIAFGDAMSYKFGTTFMVYPTEPEEHNENNQMQEFNGMCEMCEINVASRGDFLCEECLSRMALDYEDKE